MNASAPILRTVTEFPVDWPIRTAASFAPFITSGSRGWAKYYAETGDLFMRITNLDRSSIYPDLSDRQHVALPDAEREGLRTGLRSGDILISITADIGIIGFVDEKIPLPAYINQHVACLRLPTEQVCPKFVAYFLASAEPQKRFIEMTDVGAKTGINLTTVGRLTFPCPPLHEQQAISAALSDADGVVAGLERVIAKKRLIKQGAMQDLLTARRRLPGFSGEWDVKRLGDHVRFLKNGTHSRAQLSDNGPVKNLHYGDIHGASSIFLAPATSPMPTLEVETAGRLDRLTTGDLVFVDASEDLVGVGTSVEITDVNETEVVSGLHTIAARFDKSVLVDGFKAFLQFMPDFRSHLCQLAAGTKVLATNRGHIASAEIPLPQPNEQQAIATVLSDMDAEIQTLESRLTKARAVKEGMMQNLLTGRVRLV